VRVTTAEEMRQLDRLAIGDYGIPGVVLMENAGAQVARILWQEYPDLRTWRVAVLCGRGNNGGDGFVVTRYLHHMGVPVQAFLVANPETVQGEARVHVEILRRLGMVPQVVSTTEAAQALGDQLAAYDLLVDALLGTGLKAAVSGPVQALISAMNAAGKPIVAVDIPSGLSADSGTILGDHVKADLTVTMALPKRGLLLYPAANYVGRLVVADIGLPASVRDHAAVSCHWLEAQEMAALLQARPEDSHKGTYGHVLIIAGGLGKTGAGALASMAALRAGAGLATFALPKSLNAAMEAKLTEVMTLPLPEVGQGLLGAEAAKLILDGLGGRSALVIGPGLGTHPETVRCVCDVLRQVRLPVVVDADGLNALAMQPELFGEIRAPLVLTPHPGELGRLQRTSTTAIQADRLAAAQAMARSSGAVVVLKGAHTVIADPQGSLWINSTGNPGMATAGTGDVLSGMIGALLGQNYTASTAACLAVHAHGLAGDLAAAAVGQRSLLAGDVLEALPRAFQQLESTRAPANIEHHWLTGRPRPSVPGKVA
jgi:NAD(P)H-hydrate epimerase